MSKVLSFRIRAFTAHPVRGRGACPGFTLIELISVLVLMGILTAVALPRFLDNGADVRTTVDRLKIHLRHAQLRSMNSDVSWGVVSTGTEYSLFKDGDVQDKVLFLGQNSLSVAVPSGVSFPSLTLCFDDWGTPYLGADPVNGTKITQPGHTLPIADETVTILPDTGFIQ